MTVSALILNGQSLKKELARFQGAGYQLWLDDFGSGYSSLNVLQEFSFDELKIDMAFLRNFNEESRKIIQSIILMAKNLSIHTLAEGAETREQVDFLKESGCEKIQGWFVDINDETRKKEKYSRRFYMDEESGFLSYRGFMISAQHYDDALQAAGSDYEGILLQIPAIELFGKSYGTESRRKLVQAAGRAIRTVFGTRAVIGRAGVNSFLIIQNAEGQDRNKENLDKLAEKLSRIHSVDGYPCTLFMRCAVAYGREVKIIDDLRPLLLNRIAYYTK